MTERALVKICSENDTDVISVTARHEGIPIIIGIDLRSYKPFITIRKKEKANYKLLEEVFKLK